MVDRVTLMEEFSLLKLVLLFIFKFEVVFSLHSQNQSCFTCVEPLVGYTDHTDSCRFFNTASSMALSYVTKCNIAGYTGEYECRKLVISYRSVDTYLRRDCVPKGSCSWKDQWESIGNAPISDCVYTDDSEQKLECIYCCNTPLCNRTISSYLKNRLIICLMFIYYVNRHIFFYLSL